MAHVLNIHYYLKKECSGFTKLNVHNLYIHFFFVSFQSAISLREFREAEADILVHSTAAIVERFSEKGIRSKFALTSLCKKKGLHVEVVTV